MLDEGRILLGELLESAVDSRERGKLMLPLGAGSELAHRLWAAKHQNREERELAWPDPERLAERVGVLVNTAALSAGRSREAALAQGDHGRRHRALVIVDDGVATRALVAGD